MNAFPRTNVGGLSLSRMIIGTNWLAGWSHTSPAADNLIHALHSGPDSVARVLDVYMEHGVDTIMGPFGNTPHIFEAIRRTEEKHNRKMILVDTPTMDVSDTPQARQEARAVIRGCRERGAQFCLIHHSSVEQLVNKNKRTIERLDDYTDMIREEGLIPGLSAHMPELIVYSDANGYDVETYIQIYNCMGFMMQIEIETVASIIHDAKKPVMTIKAMAAGRCSPYVGLTFSWSTIRNCDMVTVGCMSPEEVWEDIEISSAALERRFPVLGQRSSPNTEQAVFGK